MEVLEMYDKLEKTQGMLRGKSLDAVCCVLLYKVFKSTPNARSIRECAGYANVDVKKFNRILKFVESKQETVDGEATRAGPLLSKYTSALGITPKEKIMILRTVKKIENLPTSLFSKIAIGILHNKDDVLQEVTVEDLSQVLGVRKETIVKNYTLYKHVMEA